jgi:ribosomal protein L32
MIQTQEFHWNNRVVSQNTVSAKNSKTRKRRDRNVWARGMVQVVECLPSKLKALSSNPGTIKERKKEKEMIM